MDGASAGAVQEHADALGRVHAPRSGVLELQDGTRFSGTIFGSRTTTTGEVVFNTGMVGYVESLTDPSYRGQILTLTYPLIGNYGVPPFTEDSEAFESDAIQVRGLVVADYSETYGHWEAEQSLGRWLGDHGIVGLTGIDTRALTRRLRSRGTMLGRIVPADEEVGAFHVADPNATDLVAEVATRRVRSLAPLTPGAGPHIVVVDCGCKRSILRALRARGCRLTVVPHDHDFATMDCDGILLSNGPGDPARCTVTIGHVAGALARARSVPVAGICLGCQLMALAAGGRTYKLPFGHRGQNQPVREAGGERCRITSQNHGYAIDADSLPAGWEVWHRNLNDGTVEGVRHASRPWFAVQFHPEAAPGPTDSTDFFDAFVEMARHGH